jgi:hypothetical protein
MNKSILLFILIMLPIMAFSQDEGEVLSKKEMRELQKEKKKALRKEEQEQQEAVTKAMIENHRFVLEADYISGKNGASRPVNSSLNFVIIDSLKAIMQLGSNNSSGINGVGGITLEGQVSKYTFTKLEKKNNNSYSVTLYITSSLGIYDIQMWVTPSGRATATVRGNVSGSLTYSGSLVPLGLSRVYKGHVYP